MKPLLWMAALVAGTSFYFADTVTTAGPLHVAWKCAGVGLLAIWAASRARSFDGWMIAGAMTLCALGDGLIEMFGLKVGALAFLAGHAVTISLYLRNRRRPTTLADAMGAALLLVATPVIAWSLPADRAGAAIAAVYASGLGAMAATAWLSRFPRGWVGAGAVLFVLSDLLIFASIGPLRQLPLSHMLVWPFYFAGQAMIAYGVVTTLDKEAT